MKVFTAFLGFLLLVLWGVSTIILAISVLGWVVLDQEEYWEMPRSILELIQNP